MDASWTQWLWKIYSFEDSGRSFKTNQWDLGCEEAKELCFPKSRPSGYFSIHFDVPLFLSRAFLSSLCGK
uniref:ABC transporter family protein n=1 Tax=Rhizophora mucronata TaxID=61149 RepID=A0A2P2M2E1_RHIMU